MYCSAWLTGVLPTHDDNEASVQEKCWEATSSVILDGISERLVIKPVLHVRYLV